MIIDCILVEDEPLAVEKLNHFISKLPFLSVVAVFNNGLDAKEYLREYTVDLVFLDIEMKSFNGIQFLETLKTKPYVIITSAHEQYAIKTYEYKVSDYLLKPYTFERFLQAVDYVYDDFTLKLKLQKESLIVAQNNEYIFVKTENRIEKLELDDIVLVEGMKDYLKIGCTSKSIMTLLSFSKLFDVLPQSRFIRVHNSYVVAVDKIVSIEKNRIKIGDRLIPVSNKYKDEFYSQIEKFGVNL